MRAKQRDVILFVTALGIISNLIFLLFFVLVNRRLRVGRALVRRLTRAE